MKSHPMLFKLLIIVGILLLVWIAWGFFSIRNIEMPSYTVLEEHDFYEIRQYDDYIVAETTVNTQQMNEGLNSGFMVIADYIFGNNTSKEAIAMTSPVVSDSADEKVSEKIAMTSPVVSEEMENQRRIAFIMPSKYTLDTLPTPNNDRVILRKVEGPKRAVHRFSWFYSEEKVQNIETQLRTALEEDGYTGGMMSFAAYNDPWTPPFMRRNEVWINIVE